MALNKTIQLVDLDICRTEYKPLANKCPKKKNAFCTGFWRVSHFYPIRKTMTHGKRTGLGIRETRSGLSFGFFFHYFIPNT